MALVSPLVRPFNKRNYVMAKPLSWLAGAGLGAGLMYLCDPERGHRRRAQLRDQARHSMGKANQAAMLAARDAANRMYGNLAEAASSLWRKQVSDEVLEERVRSKLGRYVSQPSSVRVAARRGRVTLSGRILRNELDHFVSAVQSIHGVQSVENELDALDGSGGASGQASSGPHPANTANTLNTNGRRGRAGPPVPPAQRRSLIRWLAARPGRFCWAPAGWACAHGRPRTATAAICWA